MKNKEEYLKSIQANLDKIIFFEDQKETLGNLLDQACKKLDINEAIDIYSSDMKEMLINFLSFVSDEKTLLLYEQKGMEDFKYYSVTGEELCVGSLKLPKDCLVFRSSGSTGTPKYILHNKDKSCEKFLKNHTSKDTSFNSIVLLHHGHIAWWEYVLTDLLNKETLYITNDYPHKELDYPSELFVRTTPSYLRLCLSKSYFQDDKNYSFLLGSEPMNENLMQKIKNLGHSFFQIYGSTELWGLDSVLLKNEIGIELKSVNYEVKDNILMIKDWDYVYDYVIEGGELNPPDKTYNTHDRVELRGNKLIIIGRSEDYINVGGKKIHYFSVKSILDKVDFIEDSLVYPVDNVLLGQVVGVEIIVNKLPKDYKEQIRNQFSEDIMKPVSIKVVEDFSRTNSKKVERK
jgi:acyl-coenzyme A synthetase/AMP-(fatty) acid ligase